MYYFSMYPKKRDLNKEILFYLCEGDLSLQHEWMDNSELLIKHNEKKIFQKLVIIVL